MATIGHINKDSYAAKALELLNGRRDIFVKSVSHNLSNGVSTEAARKSLVKKVKSEMKDLLFNYLNRKGIVRGNYVHRYTYGVFRTTYKEPTKSDVPSSILNIENILPNFNDVIDAMMLDAEKLRIINAIESTTEEAKGT